MTKFEECLIIEYIEQAISVSKMATTIVEAVGGEITTNIGDTMYSRLVSRIKTYLETFCDDKEKINLVLEEEIIPNIDDWEKVISAIKKLERDYSSRSVSLE